MKNDRFQVGVIASAHGLRGEVKVFPTTDDARRFDDLDEVIIETGQGDIVWKIEKRRYFKQFVILKFAGIDDINEVEPFKGKGLMIPREMAEPLGEREYYIPDLIGLTVKEDTGELLGTVKDVLQTGANDVYVVKREDGSEVLIPAIRQCILDIDVDGGKMTVHLLDGLI